MNPHRMYQGIRRAKRVLRVLRERESYWELSDLEENSHLAHLLRRTRKPCSCPKCGNPRRWFGQRTKQEQQMDEALELEIDAALLDWARRNEDESMSLEELLKELDEPT